MTVRVVCRSVMLRVVGNSVREAGRVICMLPILEGVLEL